MADYFVKGSFAFVCQDKEADLLAEVFAVAADLVAADVPDELSAAFLALFAEPGKSPLEAFRQTFDDPRFPYCGAEIELGGHDKERGGVIVTIYGMTDFQPSSIASLIRRCCPETLALGPVGFEWVETCSRPRVGEFSGGWAAIFPDRVEFETTRAGLAAALA